jgi:hypothetical protein
MHWELWDRRSANLIEEFGSEEEALQGVRDMLAVNSPDLVDEISLGAMYDEGEPRDVELPPVLRDEALKARLGEIAQEEVADAAHKVHARIRKWLAEEGWHIDEIPVPPDSFNVVALRDNGQAVNIFQPTDVLDCIALSLRWSYDRVRQLIGEISDNKLNDVKWAIYRDSSIMGVDIYDTRDSSADMILRTHVYFDGLTKDSLMQRIQLVNRAYSLAMRTSVRAQEEAGRSAGQVLSPEEVRRIMRPVAEAVGPLTAAS